MVNEIAMISNDIEMEKRWNSFKSKNYFVGELAWSTVMDSVHELVSKLIDVG